MTLDEFFEALKATDSKWHFDERSSAIRCERGNCPITAIAYDQLQTSFKLKEWDHAARALFFLETEAAEIVNTADHSFCSNSGCSLCSKLRHLRARIEDACNLGMVPWNAR